MYEYSIDRYPCEVRSNDSLTKPKLGPSGTTWPHIVWVFATNNIATSVGITQHGKYLPEWSFITNPNFQLQLSFDREHRQMFMLEGNIAVHYRSEPGYVAILRGSIAKTPSIARH